MHPQRIPGLPLKEHSKHVLWPMLVEQQILLELAGKPADPKDVYREIRTPDDECFEHDWPTESAQIPKWLLATFALPAFLEFRNLRLDKAAMPMIEPMAVLKSMVSSIAKLASAEALEQLILNPDSVPFEQKRMIFRDATTLLVDKLTPKVIPATGELAPATTLAEAIIDNVADREEEMRDELEKLPPELRERLMRQWKLETLHNMREKEAALRGS